MGEVYRARDTRLGRDVALKVLPDAFSGDADRLARFKREAQVLASLNHPHIAQIYGIEETAAGGDASRVVSAIVMELVGGVTLAEHLEASKRLPVGSSAEPHDET
jgi:serine/threonine protein kinase